MASAGSLHQLPAVTDFGPYSLLGRLALGGMAEIHLAREPARVVGGSPRYVAIKRMLPQVAADPTLIEMFMDEARLAMRLRHPAIVHIYELGQQDGDYFLAMEWVDGVSLGKLIRRARHAGSDLPAPIAVKIAATVAEALHHAHQLRGDDGEPLRLVHRDVSPQNIMVDYNGAVKLLDFGIAHSVERRSKTQQGQVRGKLAYMSPQQCKGEPVDGRSDVFALGVCLWEALSGKALFYRPTQYDTMRAVVEGEVPSLTELEVAGVDDELDGIVLRSLKKDRSERFQTAADFQLALEQWLVSRGEVVTTGRIAKVIGQLIGIEARQAPVLDTSARSTLPDSPGAHAAVAQSRSGSRAPNGSMGAEPEYIPTVEAELDEATDQQPIFDFEAASPIGSPALALASEVPSAMSRPKPRFGVPRSYLAAAAAMLLGAAAIGIWAVWTAFSDTSSALVAANEAAGAATTPPAVHAFKTRASKTGLSRSANLGASAPAFDIGASLDREASAEPAAVPEKTESTAQQIEPAPEEVASAEAVGATRRDSEIGEPGRAVEPSPRSTSSARTAITSGRRSAREPDFGGESEHSASEVDTARTASTTESESLASNDVDPATGPSRNVGVGLLSINTSPWSRVYLGERLLGTTPLGRVSVPAGRLQLRFVDRHNNQRTEWVAIEPGGHQRYSFRLGSSP